MEFRSRNRYKKTRPASSISTAISADLRVVWNRWICILGFSYQNSANLEGLLNLSKKNMFQNSESPNYLNSSPCWWCHHACWHARAIPPLRVSSNLPEKDCHQSPGCKGSTLRVTGECTWKYKWLIVSINENRPVWLYAYKTAHWTQAIFYKRKTISR